MYKIILKNRGKYNNIPGGTRYCFTKRSAKRLAELLAKNECEIDIQKFIHVRRDVFCWADAEEFLTEVK